MVIQTDVHLDLSCWQVIFSEDITLTIFVTRSAISLKLHVFRILNGGGGNITQIFELGIKFGSLNFLVLKNI